MVYLRRSKRPLNLCQEEAKGTSKSDGIRDEPQGSLWLCRTFQVLWLLWKEICKPLESFEQMIVTVGLVVLNG